MKACVANIHNQLFVPVIICCCYLFLPIQICTKIKGGMTVTRDNDRKIPYGCDAQEWVGYDDPTSLYEKVTPLGDLSIIFSI